MNNWEFSQGVSPEVPDAEKPSDIERAFAADIFEQELRTKQQQAWLDLGEENWNNPEFVDVYYKQSEQLTSEYLGGLGVNEDHTEYNQYYQAARRYSWDQMSDYEWRIGYADEENSEDWPQSGRSRLQGEHQQLFGHSIAADGSKTYSNFDPQELNPDTDNPDTDNEPDLETEPQKSLEELQADIDTLSQETSAAFADRMKVSFFRRKKKAELQAVFEEKQQALNELLKARDEKLAEELLASLNEDQVSEKLAEVMNNDAEKEGQDQRKAMIGDSRIGRAMDWYSNRNRLEKVALGLGMTAAAATIGTVAGCAGIVGGAVLGGTRLVRAYSLRRAKLYEVPEKPEPISHLNEDGTAKSVQEMTDEAAARRMTITENRIEKGDKVKKWAGVATLGSAALIGFGFATEHFDAIKDSTGRIWNGITGSGDNEAGSTIHIETESPTPEAGPNLPPAGPELPVQVPNTPSFDVSQFGDASTITRGEGWLNTFNELGVSNPREQYALLHNESLMNQLKDMGVAYRDDRIGGWGIYQTRDGKMPAEALRTIREMAVQNHYTLAR